MKDAFIAATGTENVSIRKAAQRFGVPYQTLRDRMAGTVDPECKQMGRSPVLSLKEEAKLASHLNEMALIGYSNTRQ
jgi:transposase